MVFTSLEEHKLYEERLGILNLPVAPTSGVATVGHGWARAHPTSARMGHEICTNSRSFLRSRGGGGGCRLCMNLQVRRIFVPTMNTSYVSVHSPVLSLLNTVIDYLLQMYRVSQKSSPPEVFWHFF